MPRGRPRKAELNQVVSFAANEHGVVVDYRDDVKFGRYLVVRTDPIGRLPHGQPIWLDSTEFEPTERFSKRPGVVYRANARQFGSAEQRGCACQCCPHVRGWEDEPEE